MAADAENSHLTCLVTIHGIGFQQPPLKDGTPGYADALHQHLRGYLDESVLGNDPGRTTPGPVYVQSHWPPESQDFEAGPARLGTWDDVERRRIKPNPPALVNGNSRIAHVALVYSHLEDHGFHLGSAFEAATRATLSVANYTTLPSLIRMGVVDAVGAFRHHDRAAAEITPSLYVRQRLHDTLGDAETPAQPAATGAAPDIRHNPSGMFAVVKQLEDDVTTYVCRNDLRERVKSFVQEALLRIACRPDVDSIIVNSHSQGTVASFDVLQHLPPFAAQQVSWLITSGSPLRKYADLFYWGYEAGSVRLVKRWTNFWDEKDPVADPLAPPSHWHRGDALPPLEEQTGMFQAVDPDTATLVHVPITDVQVDNLAHSAGGGLQAHNYWDNDQEFVQPLAQALGGRMT
jgi:hypothetical protein